MGPIFCPETSVRNQHDTLRNRPEKLACYILRDGCLKSRTGLIVYVLDFRLTTPCCLVHKYRRFGFTYSLLFDGKPIGRRSGTTYETAQYNKPGDYSVFFVIVQEVSQTNCAVCCLTEESACPCQQDSVCCSYSTVFV